MAQCFRFGWRRCSPLNWALTLICIYINKFNRLTDF
ncbi:acetyltransferase [Vibrio cholerae]|nr:acetyltransferase [Vibrio cholerae]EGR0943256.1 acetyltransferase [Vibrio cholerae]